MLTDIDARLATGVRFQEPVMAEEESRLLGAALVAQDLHRYVEAGKLYQTLLAQQPDLLWGRVWYVILLVQQGRVDEAIPHLQHALGRDPTLAMQYVEVARQQNPDNTAIEQVGALCAVMLAPSIEPRATAGSEMAASAVTPAASDSLEPLEDRPSPTPVVLQMDEQPAIAAATPTGELQAAGSSPSQVLIAEEVPPESAMPESKTPGIELPLADADSSVTPSQPRMAELPSLVAGEPAIAVTSPLELPIPDGVGLEQAEREDFSPLPSPILVTPDDTIQEHARGAVAAWQRGDMAECLQATRSAYVLANKAIHARSLALRCGLIWASLAWVAVEPSASAEKMQLRKVIADIESHDVPLRDDFNAHLLAHLRTRSDDRRTLSAGQSGIGSQYERCREPKPRPTGDPLWTVEQQRL